MLILRNGHVLSGKITRVDNRFNVSVDGGRISVSVADTELFCRNLDQAYAQKALMVGIGDLHGHLELAGWCQRQGLLKYAAGELSKASTIDPSHPMIPVIQRRIQMSAPPPQSPKVAATTARQPPSPQELDRTARDMPTGTMEAFVRSVGPLLVNRCGAARCHGPASQNAFHLLRPPSSNRSSRRITQLNLRAALKLIDREDPALSPLLKAALEPHGPLEVSAFGGRRTDHYQRLADWVHRVSRGSTTAISASHQEPTDQPAEHAVSALYAEPVMESSDHDSGRIPQDPAWPDTSIGDPSIPPRSKVQWGDLSPAFTPTDPFDPEIFNRRFHPRPSPAE